MSTAADSVAIFHNFVRSEDRAVATGIQGKWYPSNWHILKKHRNKAPVLLQGEMLTRFYFHLLRMGVLPGKTELKGAYPVLENAYRDHCRVRQGDPRRLSTLVDQYQGLFLFGFDHCSDIGANTGVDDYLRCRGAYEQFKKYWHIPGILARPQGLLPYAQDPALVTRLCKLMARQQFIHDDYHDPSSEYRDQDYGYTRLTFWAAMFTLRLSPFEEARDTVAAFRNTAHLPRREQQMEIMERLEVAAVGFQATLPEQKR